MPLPSPLPFPRLPSISSTSADPPSAAASSKEVPRTVMILTLSLLLTLAMALPAYMGRTNVSADSTARTSDSMPMLSLAATRGSTFLPMAEEGAMMLSKLYFSCAARTTGVTDSGRGGGGGDG